MGLLFFYRFEVAHITNNNNADIQLLSPIKDIIQMSLTKDDIQKSLRIKRTVAEYFESSNVSKIQAKELMSLFVQKEIFNSNHKDGLPIRDFLRHLYKEEQLKLIPQVHYEQKAQNINWFFIKITQE